MGGGTVEHTHHVLIREGETGSLLHLTVAPMPADEKSHPVQVYLFSAQSIVHVPNVLVQQVWQTGGVPGFMENLYLVVYPVHRLVS